MKKKLMCLTLGAIAFAQAAFAQPNTAGNVFITIPGQTGPGPNGTFQVFATGTVNGSLVSNFALTNQDAVSMNTIFTVNGQQYGILLATQPNAFNPLQNGLFDAFVVVDMNGNGQNNVNYASLGNQPGQQQYGGDQVFGNQTGNFTVVPVPFDFGISAVLGAGAFAAVRTARKRRKEQADVAVA